MATTRKTRTAPAAPVVQKTLAEVQAYNLEALLFSAKSAREGFQDAKAKFLADCDRDPLYAISWGSSFLSRAAEMKVWQKIEALVTTTETHTGLTTPELYARLLEEVLGFYTPRSTSALSNEAELAQQEATRTITKSLKYLVAKEKRAAAAALNFTLGEALTTPGK
jgi:hypothetical protein